jgi:hypothetical protein
MRKTSAGVAASLRTASESVCATCAARVSFSVNGTMAESLATPSPADEGSVNQKTASRASSRYAFPGPPTRPYGEASGVSALRRIMRNRCTTFGSLDDEP